MFWYTLITKKFGRKNNSDKKVSENLTVQKFRHPKFFTSKIFPELFHRENENNVYFALTIWRFFTTKSIFFLLLLLFFYFMKFGLDYFNPTNNLPNSFIFMRFRASFPHFLPKFSQVFGYNYLKFCPKFCPKLSKICWKTVRSNY